MSKLRIVGRVLAIVAAVIVGCTLLIIVLDIFGKTPPNIRVTATENSRILDVRTLAEYPTTITRITISSQTEGTVLDLRGVDAQIGLLKLRIGANDTRGIRMDHGSFQKTIPVDSTSYVLKPNMDYSVRMWRGWGSSRVHVKF